MMLIYLAMRMKRSIESPANPKIKEILKIRDGKAGEDLWVVEGEKSIQALVGGEAEIVELLSTGGSSAEESALERLLPSKGIGVTQISQRVAKHIAATETTQGVFAVVRFKIRDLNEISPGPEEVVAVLDGIQDPGNVGTILRTADALGVRSVIMTEGTCRVTNQKVVRSSAGSIFRLHIAWVPEEQLLSWASRQAMRMVVTDARAPLAIGELSTGGKLAVVFGNESEGVRPAIRRRADALVSVPLWGGAESLNVAAAAAIVLYEITQKKRKRAAGEDRVPAAL
ncbi:MAG: TrmH family RNA methyltransferase [Thermodesulfovibrionales bacterium]